MSKSPAIGVDLGTTYCCVAVYNGGEDVNIIPNHLDKNTTPSYVAFCDGDITVGDTAKNQAHENPENTIFDVKRMIGRSLQDPFIQRDRKLWPFDLKEVDGRLRVKADDRNLLPEEISTEMLIYLKEIAEANLGCPVTAAVITVPAYFTDYQRYLTKQAAIQAGLKPLQLIREPTAAAIAYNLHRRDHTPQNCLIFDLGGGTFDVAVLTIEQNFIQVRAIGGDARLGGEDFDNIMVDYCIEEFKTQNSVDLAEGKDSDSAAVRFKVSKRLRRIKKECEKQKCYLSQARAVVVSLDAICGELDLAVEFTRGIFENLVEERLSRCIDIVEGVLKDSDFAKEDIHDVVLIGGSSRIPKLQAILQEYFGGKTLYRAINPDEAVAAGAAIQAYFANNRDLAGIGIEEPDFVVPNPVALAGSTTAADSGSESPSAPTSDPSSPWSSGVSMRPTLERSNSESPTPTHSKVLRRPAAVLSQMSFTTLSTQSLTCHLALYFDEYMVRIFDLTDGKFDVSSKPVLEVQPFVAIKDSKLYVGSEALKYQHLDSFYRIMDLLTKPTNKICQMAVAGKSDFGILFEEEIIAAFLLKVKQRVEKVLRSSVLQVVITLPFIPTGAQRGRIQVATVLVDLVKVKIYSNLTLTALSYASMRTSLRQATVFETIRFLVVHYGHGFFSTAVVEYSPTMVRIRSYNSSYLLPEEDHIEFMAKHAMSFEEQDDDEDDEIARHAETYLPFMQSACSEIDKNSIDFGFLIRNQESKSIDDFVTLFFDKTVYTFNDVRGPLTGASILASQNFKFGSTQVVDVIPGNLQCSILRDRRVNVIYDEPHASSDKHGTVFSYPLVLDRERPVAISLVETVLDKACDICVYRVSAKYINEPRAVSAVLTCEIDVDGMYHLGLDYVQTEGVSIDFFRTDKLNSEFSIISNKVDNFNKFFNAVSKSRRGLTGWLTSKKLK